MDWFEIFSTQKTRRMLKKFVKFDSKSASVIYEWSPKENGYASSFKRFAIPNQLRSRSPLDSLECRIPSGLCRKKRRGRGRGHCWSLVHILWSGQEHFNQQIAAFECRFFNYKIDPAMLLFYPVDRCWAGYPGIFSLWLTRKKITYYFFSMYGNGNNPICPLLSPWNNYMDRAIKFINDYSLPLQMKSFGPKKFQISCMD